MTWRWAVVVIGLAAALALPGAVALLPVQAAPVSAAALLAKVRASAGISCGGCSAASGRRATLGSASTVAVCRCRERSGHEDGLDPAALLADVAAWMITVLLAGMPSFRKRRGLERCGRVR